MAQSYFGLANPMYGDPQVAEQNARGEQQKQAQYQQQMAAVANRRQVQPNNQLAVQSLRQDNRQDASDTRTQKAFDAQQGHNAQRDVNSQKIFQRLTEPFGGNFLDFNASASGNAPSNAPTIQRPDTTAATAAAFARAKDKVGQIARGAMTGLRSSLGARGQLGAGHEGALTADVINKGAGQLGEVSRDQAIQDVGTANQFELARYNGEITQRGQNMQANNQREVGVRDQYLKYLDILRGLY